MSTPKAFFQERLTNYSTELEQVSKQTNLVSILRLISILLVFPLIYGFATTGSWLFLPLAILLIAVFIFLVSRHQTLSERKSLLEALVQINEEELLALDGTYNQFPSGVEYVDSSHSYTFDMDIFGDHSLFQYMNRTTTLLGKNRLVEILSNPLESKAQILERQQQVTELSEKPEFIQTFKAKGMNTNEAAIEIDLLYHWLEEPNFYASRKGLQVVRFLVPIIILTLGFLSIPFPILSPLFGFSILLSWSIGGSYAKKINGIHSKVSQKNGVLGKYGELLKIQAEETFTDPALKSLQSFGRSSIKEIEQLSKLVNRFDTRLNQLVGIFLNTFFLFDFHCVAGLEKWKTNNKDKVEGWLTAMAEVDALNSLGNFKFCHPHFILPTINEESSAIEGLQMGHPLIPYEDCVSNDLTLGDNEKMVILTGANMSGKSTFLRTLGVNTILALTGGPVFADSFVCPIVKIKTSMRLTDSLSERASYFYAELKRLQSIIESLKSGDRILIICDEVLKGTNSEDKLTGSIALIRRFLEYNCLGIIATHDLDLGKLEAELPGLVSNHCFESIIEGDELRFDYTLNAGIAQNKNATFLMGKMGIV